MNIKNNIILLVTTALSIVANVTYADPVVVNITGKVTSAPCTVDASSVNQTVDFFKVPKSHLKNAGEASDWKSFQVKLINCPIATSNAKVTFSGNQNDADNTLYANSGTAVNVAIQLAQDADKSKTQGNNSTMTVNVDAQHNATYNLAGRLISVEGNAGPGTINSVVQMNFVYQ